MRATLAGKQLVSQIEAFFLETFLSTDHWFHKVIERGGIYALALLPFIEAFRTYNYYKRGKKKLDNNEISLTNFIANLSFYTTKTLLTTAGVAVLFAGITAIGFGLVIGAAGLGALRHLYKACDYLAKGLRAAEPKERKDCFQKSRSNLEKFAIGATLTAGFAVMTFIPGLNIVGWTMAFAACSYVVGKIAWHKAVKPGLKKLLRRNEHKVPERKVSSSEVKEPLIADVKDRALQQETAIEENAHAKKPSGLHWSFKNKPNTPLLGNATVVADLSPEQSQVPPPVRAERSSNGLFKAN